MKRIAPLLALALLCGSAPVLVAQTTGCTPAESAAFVKAEQIVLADLTNNVALDVIEGAIAAYVPQGQDVDVVINDIITYLHDDGALPPNVLPVALAMQTKIAMKLSSKGK
jgi:hypothetical protein